jgi:hypothetical protein
MRQRPATMTAGRTVSRVPVERALYGLPAPLSSGIFAPRRLIGPRNGARLGCMRDEDLSTARITSLATLERAVAEIGSLFSRPPTAIWRGHANLGWPLRAEVFRAQHEGRQYDERTLMQAFLAQAESRHRNCPPHGDVVGWLMLARQSGLPTRLLDWTRNPLVALYFACQPDLARPDADGCVWALDPALLNLRVTGRRAIAAADDIAVRRLFTTAFGDSDLDDAPEADALVAVRMRDADHRVVTQQGCYTVHQDGKDLTELDHRYVNDPVQPNPVWRRAFVVPRTHKRHLLDLLAALGIQRSTLFLDLETLADDLKRTTPRLAGEVGGAF